MRDTLSTACIVLWPTSEEPHPALRLDPWQAAEWVMNHWDIKTMRVWPGLAKVTLCKIAILVQYPTREQRWRAVSWVCAEAPNWWPALAGQSVTENHIRQLFTILDNGRA